MNVFEEYPELGEVWFRRNQTMMGISGPQGEVYDANDALLHFLKYALSEFTRREDPVTWHRFTLQDESFEADKAESEKCLNGERPSYTIRKYYVPKNSFPRLVELHVTRFPLEGGRDEFKFFFVTITDLEATASRAFDDIYELSAGTLKALESINQKLDGQLDHRHYSNYTELKELSQQHPRMALAAFMLFSVILLVMVFNLFGRSVIEIMTAVKDMFSE
ncbi:MAG: hypothetical protein R3C11_13615 [Planctomycetaceae bacterium]